MAAAGASAVPAFPGAEGFGAGAKGARASASPTVYHVTNLDDSGTGSLRDAVSASNRIVVFDIGGIIRIKTPVVFSSGLTIAGQTAPGGGITVYGNRVSFSGANNTICRYMRFRMGIDGDDGADAVGLANGTDLIFDHVSASWGRDETFSISGDAAIRITLQDCLIAQGLRIHSAGGLMQTSGGVSIFRSLYADNWMRNPKIKGVNDYINNVVYNWGGGGGYIPAGDSAGDSYCNMVGCYFIGGPESGVGTSPFKSGNSNYRLYHSGNLQDLDLDGVLDGTAVTNSSFPTLQLTGTRFNYPAPTTELTAPAALEWVLTKAGASLKRDRTDDYVVAEARTYGTGGVFIYNEAEMGGIGTVTSGLKIPDADNDGMPDWWEQAAGTNPAVADATTLGADGYLNIERYLNAIVLGGVPGAAVTGISTDTGAFANDGITSDANLALNGTAPAGASVSISRADTGSLGSVAANASGQWTYNYTATPLADRTYAFTAIATVGGMLTPPSPSLVVRVDTVAAQAPAITAISLAPSLSIQGTATPGDTLAVKLSGNSVGTAVADDLGNWSAIYTGSALVAGTYSFTAIATDLAGNTGVASTAYLVNTAITPPAFTTISTDSGVSTSDRLTSDTTLSLSGTAPAGSTVSVTRAGVGVVGTATATSGGAFSFSYTGTTLPAGDHLFTATASTGGTASPASAAFAVTVDTTAPTVASIKRLNPATYSTNGGTVVYRVTFAEPVVGVDLADLALTKPGTAGTLSSLAAVSTTVYEVTATGTSGDGTLRLDLDASGTGITDLAGNAISGGYTSGQSYTIRLAGSGVWGSTDTGGLWSDSGNWNAAVIAGGTGTTADFSLCDPVEDTSLIIDSPRTVGRLVFGDTDYDSPASWTVSDGGVPARSITLDSSSTPVIEVDALTTAAGDTTDVPADADYPQHLAVALTGTKGFTKTGVGNLELNRPNPALTGPLVISKGIVQIGTGGTLAPSSVTISTSQQLRVAGGGFTTGGNVSWTSGTGTGVIVSGGTAGFQNILPSNTRNSFFKVTGGTVTGADMNFPRSGDSEAQTTGTGVLISGGDTTFANIGLGTSDSWGGMTISGGKLTVTGTLHNGYQKTAGRGGVIYLSAGELAVNGAANGLVMSRNNANTNNVSKLLITGGTANLAKLTLGYDATVTAGSATVTVTNGSLNLGAGGIVKNGTSGLASSITLNSGALGALANWSTTHPLALTGTTGNLAIRASDLSGTTRDISLAGVLSGSGGFSKTGGGTLFLSDDNTFTGNLAINAGTIDLSGTLATGGTVTVNSGGTLAGNGGSQKPVSLASGGVISPNGTLTFASLTWNAGGRLSFDLGAANELLAIGGALTKSGTGTFAIDFSPVGALAVGTPQTLATFASVSNFTAGNFTFTGLGYATGHFTLTATSLQFTVDDDGVAKAPFFDWLVANNIAPSTSEATTDPDRDGIGNLMEFILGTEPDAAGSSGVIATTVASGGQIYPAIRYPRRQARGGVVVSVQVSETPAFSPSSSAVEVSAVAQGNGIEQVVARSTVSISQVPRQFLRVRGVLP